METRTKENDFAKLLQRALREGGEFADIFHEKREDVRISLSSDLVALPAFGFSEGMALRLFWRQPTGFDGLLRPGMINGELEDVPITDQVDAAVSDVSDVQLIVHDGGCREYPRLGRWRLQDVEELRFQGQGGGSTLRRGEQAPLHPLALERSSSRKTGSSTCDG